ncbi:hypothetical protein Dimus_004504 [Dionaea muscipula]
MVRSSRSQLYRSSGHGRCRSGGGRADGMAMCLINGVATAFFGSLEKCYCIGVATVEDADDNGELPLIRDGIDISYHQRAGIKDTENKRIQFCVDGDVREGGRSAAATVSWSRRGAKRAIVTRHHHLKP